MGTGKKKIEIKKKEKAEDRMVTFSKRKKGLFKKASQLHALSGSQIGILLFSPAGRPHTNDPLFDSALLSYLSSLEPRGGTGNGSIPTTNTGAINDIGTSRSNDDGSFELWLDSIENLLLGPIDEGGGASTANVDDGSMGCNGNKGSLTTWTNSVESFVGEESGANTDAYRCIREWLNSIQVDGIQNLEDLLFLKQRLENIREKVAKKVDDAICTSFLV